MPATRLSPLDDSFLGLEGPTSHMHVGWMALFDPPPDRPPPGFEELRRHVASRVSRAPRYRQKVSPAPLEIDAPSWIDDERFDVARHVLPTDSSDRGACRASSIATAPCGRSASPTGSPTAESR